MLQIGLVALLGISTLPAMADARLPLLESIAGAETVSLKGAGKPRQAHAGDEIRPGERIKTPANVSARVLYSDGTQIVVGQNSEAELLKQDGESRSQRLHSGQIWGQVAKVKGPGPGKNKPRYMIRTKNAIMGVRGTEFVVDQGAKEAKFHTLEGEVEIARDEAALTSGKSTKLIQDQMLTAKAGKLEAPKAFDRQKFMTALTAKQPQFQQFLQQAPKSFEQLKSMPQPVLPPAPAAPVLPPAPVAPAVPSIPSVPQKKIGF